METPGAMIELTTNKANGPAKLKEEVPQEIEAIRSEHAMTLRMIEEFEITTVEERDALLGFSKKMKDAQKAIAAELDPKISVAHKLHKDLCEMKTRFSKPYKDREANCDRKISAWNSARRLQLEAEAKALRDKADTERKAKEDQERKAIEDQRLVEAAKFEELGFAEEAQSIIEQPIEVTVSAPLPAPVVQDVKMEGAHDSKTYVGAIINPILLMAEIVAGRQPVTLLFEQNEVTKYWECNPKGLAGVARALKKEMMIPGCAAIEKVTLVKK